MDLINYSIVVQILSKILDNFFGSSKLRRTVFLFSKIYKNKHKRKNIFCFDIPYKIQIT